VCKAAEKEVVFDLNQAREPFMKAKNNFFEASTLGSQEKSLKTVKYRTWILTISYFSEKLYVDFER